LLLGDPLAPDACDRDRGDDPAPPAQRHDVLRPPHHQRRHGRSQLQDPNHQEDGLRLSEPRALQDGHLLPLRRPRPLPGYPRKSRMNLDYYDTEGKRHRKKAAPDYQTAKLVYRDRMTKLAKGEVTGIREKGVTVARFVAERYWPTVKPTVSPEWATR